MYWPCALEVDRPTSVAQADVVKVLKMFLASSLLRVTGYAGVVTVSDGVRTHTIWGGIVIGDGVTAPSIGDIIGEIELSDLQALLKSVAFATRSRDNNCYCMHKIRWAKSDTVHNAVDIVGCDGHVLAVHTITNNVLHSVVQAAGDCYISHRAYATILGLKSKRGGGQAVIAYHKEPINWAEHGHIALVFGDCRIYIPVDKTKYVPYNGIITDSYVPANATIDTRATAQLLGALARTDKVVELVAGGSQLRMTYDDKVIIDSPALAKSVVGVRLGTRQLHRALSEMADAGIDKAHVCIKDGSSVFLGYVGYAYVQAGMQAPKPTVTVRSAPTDQSIN
jgi:hypothetical protein